MTPQRAILAAAAVLLCAVGCGPRDDTPSASTPSAGTAPATTAAAVDTSAAQSPTGAAPPVRNGTNYRVTYGWAVPSRPVRVAHTVRVPVVPPPGPPLPMLRKIETGDHPADNYTRITFAFTGGTPSYELAYVPRVESEGDGRPVPLTGNSFLRIKFDQAQAHDERGGMPAGTPPPALGYPTLRGYGFGGDFEGHVTYGLGIQVAAGSDQALPIRAGELLRPDGSHVVAIDVRRG